MSSIFLMFRLTSIQTCYKKTTPSPYAIVTSLFIPRCSAHPSHWDSVCSCPPFTFHQLGDKHWWGHCNIASVRTSALYLSCTLLHIRLMSSFWEGIIRVDDIWTKRISPEENKMWNVRLLCSLCLMRQNILFSLVEFSQTETCRAWSATSLKQEV